MGAWSAAAQITLPRQDMAGKAPRAGFDDNLGAVGVAFQVGIDGADAEPVAALGGDVAEQPCGPGDARDEQVKPAVAIEVRAHQAAENAGSGAERVVGRREIAELAFAVI